MKYYFNRKELFTKATVKMYGKMETVHYYTRDLLWGNGYYTKLRFVLAYTRRGRIIIASTSLNLSAEEIIELYASRFNIECMFKDIKQEFAGFFGHFWSKSVPELDRFASSDAPDPLDSVVDEKSRAAILENIHAMEAYALVAGMALGICQIIAIKQPAGGRIQTYSFMRTFTPQKVSVNCVRRYLREMIRTFVDNGHSSPVLDVIRKNRVKKGRIKAA